MKAKGYVLACKGYKDMFVMTTVSQNFNVFAQQKWPPREPLHVCY